MLRNRRAPSNVAAFEAMCAALRRRKPMNDLSFFATQGPISRPGARADLFDSFPTAIGELCAVVQGITVHPFWAERYGLNLTAERVGGAAPYHGEAPGPRSGTRFPSAGRTARLLHRRRPDFWFRLHEPERCWNDHRHIADNSEA